jgi:hypothetical protein
MISEFIIISPYDARDSTDSCNRNCLQSEDYRLKSHFFSSVSSVLPPRVSEGANRFLQGKTSWTPTCLLNVIENLSVFLHRTGTEMKTAVCLDLAPCCLTFRKMSCIHLQNRNTLKLKQVIFSEMLVYFYLAIITFYVSEKGNPISYLRKSFESHTEMN